MRLFTKAYHLFLQARHHVAGLRALAKAPRLAPRFFNDQSGAIAIIFALALMPIAALIGLVLDYGTAARDKDILQKTLDAALLSATRTGVYGTREIAAAQNFNTTLPESLRQRISTSDFIVTTDQNLTGKVVAFTETSFSRVMGFGAMVIEAKGEAKLVSAGGSALEIVTCIDATSGKQETLTAFASSIPSIYNKIQNEVTRRGMPRFDSIRIRPIYYRDFGGYDFDPTIGGTITINTALGDQMVVIAPNAANASQYLGDSAPIEAGVFTDPYMRMSVLWNFAQSKQAWGGGDPANSGYECLNEALNSPFLRKGDVIPNSSITVENVTPVIAFITNEDTHPVPHSRSLLNQNYPLATLMPRSLEGLLAKWNDSSVFDPTNRILLFFGTPQPGWQPLMQWPRYNGNLSLNEGQNLFATRLAERLVQQTGVARLTK